MKWTKEHMFEPSGCFTRETFEALVNKTLPVDAMALANKHLRECPFCSDALEGFQSRKVEQKFTEVVSHADQAFGKLLSKRDEKSSRKKIIWITVSAAASVLLLVGLFIVIQNPKPNMKVAENVEKDTLLIEKPAQANKKEVTEKQKTDKSKDALVKSERKTVRFTPPVVTEEQSESDLVLQDKLVTEAKPEVQTDKTEKTSALASAAPTIKSESSNEFISDETAAANDFKKNRQSLKAKQALYGRANTPNTFVEQMPSYPGGQDSLMAFLRKNIQYPANASEMGISGKVILQFVIGKDGQISNINVLRGIGGGCDEEAVRVVKLMPKWVPGKQNGEAVPVYFTLPIVFNLQK
ncbi:MAG TPA: TonB family protein [Bacteroidales bacterium]